MKKLSPLRNKVTVYTIIFLLAISINPYSTADSNQDSQETVGISIQNTEGVITINYEILARLSPAISRIEVS